MTRLVMLLPLCSLACQPLDVSQPIALAVGDDWPPVKANALAAAADCWNVRFGTKLGVAVNAAHTQQVAVDFEPAICPFAEAGTTAWPPRGVYICPGQYLHENGSNLTRLFSIVLHELGHVLNINVHAPDEPPSVMGVAKHVDGVPMMPLQFSTADASLFYEANPDFDAPPPCETVTIPRSFDGDTGCACVR